MNILPLLLSVVLGYSIARFFSGKKESEDGLIKSLKFQVFSYGVHVHHWIIGLFGIILLAVFGYYSDILYGLCIGLIVQGLSYKDFYRVVYKK